MHHTRDRTQLESHLTTSLGLITYELPCEIRYLQETVSQRGRAKLRVDDNFAKPLNVMQNDTVEDGMCISSY